MEGGMTLGNCGKCGGTLWQGKVTGEPAVCDHCLGESVGEQEKPDDERGMNVSYAKDKTGKVVRKLKVPNG